jgi:NitT/TauT family transport system substrate-binding protein
MDARESTRRVLAACAGVVLLATACGDDGEEAGDNGELDEITIGTLPISNASPMYLGMELGYFEEEGLDVEVAVLQGGNEIIQGLVSEDYQFGFVGYISAGVAAAQDVPVCVVSGSDMSNESTEDDWQLIVAGADGDVQEPEDLEGATIGINALGGVAEVMTYAALEQQLGIDPDAYELLEVPFPEVPAALEEGRIDAGFTSEPFVTMVLDAGGTRVYSPQAETASHYPNGSYAAAEPFVAENADLVERFRAAMDRSVDYAEENTEEVREIIPEFTEIDSELAERIELPTWGSQLDESHIEQQLEYLDAYGLVDESVTTDELLC